MSLLTDMLAAVGQDIRRQEQHLCELDAAVGDGDHGVTLVRCWAAVEARLADLEHRSPSVALRIIGEVVISSGGGAIGPLLGTGLLRAAEAVQTGAPAATLIAAGLEAADEGIQQRGRAAVGDRSLVDALHPAALAAGEAAATGSDPRAVMQAAASAAEEGASQTARMSVRVGRATRMGDQALGHIDPGAASVALMLRSAAEYLAKHRR